MSEYKNISIDITENGYIICVDSKKYIFDDINKMREWIEENICATGDIKQFSEALDDDNDTDKMLADVLSSAYTRWIGCGMPLGPHPDLNTIG